MRVELVQTGEPNAYVFTNVRSVLTAGSTVTITVDNEYVYRFRLNEIITIFTENG